MILGLKVKLGIYFEFVLKLVCSNFKLMRVLEQPEMLIIMNYFLEISKASLLKVYRLEEYKTKCKDKLKLILSFIQSTLHQIQI